CSDPRLYSSLYWWLGLLPLTSTPNGWRSNPRIPNSTKAQQRKHTGVECGRVTWPSLSLTTRPTREVRWATIWARTSLLT
ncbi:digestive cysteine protease intestain, partial [Elysia marginata]